MKEIDFDEARRFISILGKPAGTIRLRAFLHREHPDKATDKGRKGGASKSLIRQWQSEGRGVYVVVNDGGDTNDSITACRAFFAEWDDRPREWQLTAWQELGLPEPTFQIDTGGKSIHSYWVLQDPVTPAHWSLVQTRLLDYCDADRSIKNVSRVMRLPGSYYALADGSLGEMCVMVASSGARYTVDQIETCLPEEEFYLHQRKADSFADHSSRSMAEVREALACIPQRRSGDNTYEKYRNILWALKKACIEAGGTEDDAIALMEDHSPTRVSGWGVRQVATSGGDHINASTFWYWARHHGWRPPLPARVMTPRAAVADAGAAVDPGEVVNLQLYDKTGTDWLDLTVQHVFRHPQQRWLCADGILHLWSGTHYEPKPDEELAPEIAAFLSLLHVIPERSGEPTYPWRRPRYVDEALQWMRRLLKPVAVNPSNAINCRNGVVSWSWSGRKLEVQHEAHHPDQHFTYVTGYDYDPDADGRHLFRLLDAVEQTDKDTMQRILGSGLDLTKYRATRGRPRAVLMIGEGSNGKDTIRTALRDTLGSRNFTSCTLADFRQYDQGRKFPIAPLRDASVNWSSENSQFVSIDNLQSLKAAISGEELSYELKGIQESQFVPSALFVFNLNKDPSLTGEQAAIETRFHVFRFRKVFMAKPTEPNHLQADPRLKDDPAFIQQYICPAFLNWLLEGLSLSVEWGIDYSSGKQAMEEVRRASCHLWEFCDSVGLAYEADSQVSVKRVWDKLQEWYKEEGYQDDKGRWIMDPPNDRTVKAPRLLVDALRQIFPKLASARTGKSRDRVITNLRMDAW
jgi:putative DNA primase/helicase